MVSPISYLVVAGAAFVATVATVPLFTGGLTNSRVRAASEGVDVAIRAGAPPPDGRRAG